MHLQCTRQGTWDPEVSQLSVALCDGAFSKVCLGNGAFLVERKLSNIFAENRPQENF